MTKPIQIRRDDVVANIRRLSALTGRSITDVVDSAIRSELSHVTRSLTSDERRQSIGETLKRFRAAVGDHAPPGDEFFYDEDGLPK